MSLSEELAQFLTRDIFPNRNWRRLRIAVSPEEHARLMVEAFDRGNDFFERIRDVPFVIEENPLNPELRQNVRPINWEKRNADK